MSGGMILYHKIIGRLAAGDGTCAVADRFGMTPGRVSHLRRRYQRSWQIFQGQASSAAEEHQHATSPMP